MRRATVIGARKWGNEMATLELNWGTVRQASLVELIDAAGAAGFGAITVPPGWYSAALAEGHTDAGLRDRLAERGVEIGYIDALTTGLPGQTAEFAARWQSPTYADCVAAARGLGATRLNVAHFGGSPVGLDVMTEALDRVARRAREDGLSLLLEFLPGTGIPDLATAVKIVGDVGADDVGILFDSWHHYRSVPSIAAGAQIPFELIRALQLSDMPAERVGSWQADDPTAAARNSQQRPMSGRLLPGAGVLPLTEVVAGTLAVHPEVAVGLEVFSDELRALPVAEVAALSAGALRLLLA